MSYCRWSTDCFQCDVYVYEHVDGHWRIHVAGSRYTSDEPHPSDYDWVKRHLQSMAWVKRAHLVPIGLPHDGESFECASPGECAARLLSLREVGYTVPQFAIDALLEEQKELGDD